MLAVLVVPSVEGKFASATAGAVAANGAAMAKAAPAASAAAVRRRRRFGDLVLMVIGDSPSVRHAAIAT
jgi:hypothetical protein